VGRGAATVLPPPYRAAAGQAYSALKAAFWTERAELPDPAIRRRNRSFRPKITRPAYDHNSPTFSFSLISNSLPLLYTLVRPEPPRRPCYSEIGTEAARFHLRRPQQSFSSWPGSVAFQVELSPR
jgi:hypothetical protein